ncbi:hypothetical protein INS49_010423 [Diaporthe citri]|uniref:uncharacterized protein n=1 Tax=Diaporthe citri TaxID=83186 RepID=UPI001C7FCEC4|nr:uncharacterized protein INS49_010423 [Diaporthe citri]KAG6362193.1 hypothetical protein INS49_010423 [Diaporthe citri]
MPLLSEPRPRKPEPVIRRLLPRQTASQSGGLAITVGRALPSIRLHGSDVLYFDFFRSEASKELSGYLPSSFWSRIVLCETLTDSCIRHAILALGAASYPLVARNQHLPWSSSNDATSNAHGRAAICHHTKALALFREMMANGIDNFPSRSAFIVTPLLVAFTMLQSNNKAAETLLSGLKALQEVCQVWQGKHVRGGSKGPLINEEMEELTCPMLQVYMLCGHNPLYPTQKGNVFTIPSNMFLDSSPPPDWSDRPVTASLTDSVLAIWTSFTSRCLVWLRHCDYTKHSQAPGIYTGACEEQTDLLARLSQWQQFIYGLHPAPGLDTVYSRALQLVRLQYEILFIWASEALDRTRMGFDVHTARFESVVQDCAELLGHDLGDSPGGAEDCGTLGQYSPAPQTGYTFESFGVVSVLGFVVTRCRVGPIRRRGLAILERIWWRENGWDTIANNRGAKALMELEEQGGIRGADGELFIPAESRYYWGGARWENDLPASQKLICTFAQRRPDELGEVFGVPVVIDLRFSISKVAVDSISYFFHSTFATNLYDNLNETFEALAASMSNAIPTGSDETFNGTANVVTGNKGEVTIFYLVVWSWISMH